MASRKDYNAIALAIKNTKMDGLSMGVQRNSSKLNSIYCGYAMCNLFSTRIDCILALRNGSASSIDCCLYYS